VGSQSVKRPKQFVRKWGSIVTLVIFSTLSSPKDDRRDNSTRKLRKEASRGGSKGKPPFGQSAACVQRDHVNGGGGSQQGGSPDSASQQGKGWGGTRLPAGRNKTEQQPCKKPFLK